MVKKAEQSGIQQTRLCYMLTAICLGAFISHLSAGIVNVALPDLIHVFGSSIDTIQWVTTGYLLVVAALLPVMGKLADRIGKRRIHNIGYVLFAIGSLLSALSFNISSLLLFRVLQGVGAAMFQSTNIALISTHFPKERRGRALGFVSMAVAFGAMSGPVVGGMIYQWVSWRWLFLIYLPISLCAIILAYRFIPSDGRAFHQEPFDVKGALLFAAVTVFVIVPISCGNSWGWNSNGIILTGVIAVISLLFFISWERRHEKPFIPLNLFANRIVLAGVLISCGTYIAAFSAQVTFPFYLKGIYGLSSIETGIVMMAYPLFLAVAGPVSGALSDRYGSKNLTMLGLCIIFVSTAMLVFMELDHSWWVTLPALLLLGFGMGMVTSPNYALVMGQISKAELGMVGGLIALARNMGLVIGASLGFALLFLWAPSQAKSEHAMNLTERAAVLFGLHIVFLVGAMLTLCCIALLIWATKRETQKQDVKYHGV